jgi:hypothetical protein
LNCMQLPGESCESFDGMHVRAPLMCYSASLRIRSPESCSRMNRAIPLYMYTPHMLCAHVLPSGCSSPRLQKREMKIDGPNRETFFSNMFIIYIYMHINRRGRHATHTPLRANFNHPFVSFPLSQTHTCQEQERFE